MDNHDDRLTLSRNAQAWSQVGSEIVLLDLRASEYLGLNKSGSALWTSLANGTNFSTLVAVLTEQFGISADQAAEDVSEFIRLCDSHGLISHRQHLTED